MSDNEINNDELAAFVTSTLNAIASGVDAAASGNYSFRVPDTVNFEVAVRATNSKEAGGGLKIQVFSAEGKKSIEDESVSRISFEVRSKDNRVPRNVPQNKSNWMA